MMWFVGWPSTAGTVTLTSSQLQSALSSGSASVGAPNMCPPGQPHHPITCQGDLRYEENGGFACPHAVAEPGDVRTQAALNQSAAMMLIELAQQL